MTFLMVSINTNEDAGGPFTEEQPTQGPSSSSVVTFTPSSPWVARGSLFPASEEGGRLFSSPTSLDSADHMMPGMCNSVCCAGH